MVHSGDAGEGHWRGHGHHEHFSSRVASRSIRVSTYHVERQFSSFLWPSDVHICVDSESSNGTLFAFSFMHTYHGSILHYRILMFFLIENPPTTRSISTAFQVHTGVHLDHEQQCCLFPDVRLHGEQLVKWGRLIKVSSPQPPSCPCCEIPTVATSLEGGSAGFGRIRQPSPLPRAVCHELGQSVAFFSTQ